MRLSRRILPYAALAATTLIFARCATAPAPALAGIIPGGACKVIGDLNTLGGKACEALRNPSRVLKTSKSLITGHIGNAIKQFLGSGGASSASTALGLAAIVAWIVEGARTAVHEMGKVIDETAAPNLGSVWFSSTYWRIAAVSALLTLPFLFAAAVQALMRSDLSLLVRAAFGHLPLALVGVGIAAPVAMLLLSGTDELCALVWSPSSSNGLTSLFAGGGTVIGVVAIAGSPFLAFLLCLFTAGAAMLVWLELAMREAAVYIVVLMLPLAFAALVWPARRVWAVRAVEILVALILSKFAIVAVLGLGGAALDQAGAHGLSAMLAGMVLVLLAALAPWAVLRLVPIAEVASSASSALRPHAMASLQTAWPSKKAGAKAEERIANVASNIADLARRSTDGGAAGHGLATSNGYSRNGGARTERAPYDLEDEAVEAAAAQDDPEDGLEQEDAERAAHANRVGVAADANRAGVAADAGGAGSAADAGGANSAADVGVADLASHTDRADPADPGGLSGPQAAGDRPAEERVPGADPLWQAPDMSWRPLPLGLDEGWPPDPPWPAEGAAEAEPSTAGAGGAATGSDSGTTPPFTRSAAEQSDPLPPGQDRGGPL